MTLGREFDAVLTAAKAGGEWAVETLYAELQPWLLRYLLPQEGPAAEEIVARAWVEVAKGLQGFQGTERDFRRFVFTIARSEATEHRRLARWRRRPDGESSLNVDRAGSNPGPDGASHQALATISRLPREEADIVLLRCVGALTAEEVAAITGKRTAAVRELERAALLRLSSDPVEVLQP